MAEQDQSFATPALSDATLAVSPALPAPSITTVQKEPVSATPALAKWGVGLAAAVGTFLVVRALRT
jgi:hypothetical protein